MIVIFMMWMWFHVALGIAAIIVNVVWRKVFGKYIK